MYGHVTLVDFPLLIVRRQSVPSYGEHTANSQKLSMGQNLILPDSTGQPEIRWGTFKSDV